MNNICKSCKSYLFQMLDIIEIGRIEIIKLSKFIHKTEYSCPKKDFNNLIIDTCSGKYKNIIHCHSKYKDKCISFIEDCEMHHYGCTWDCHEECKCQKI